VLLDDKRLLITGVLNDASIAFSVARLAQEQGAQIVLTGFGRAMRITERVAKRLPEPPDVLELDVTEPDHLERVAADLDERWGALDGVVHAIAFAPQTAMGGQFMQTPWEDVAHSVHVSTYSLVALARAFGPLLGKTGGGAIVGLDFDASVAWPAYDWMGVAKAGLESCARYLARDLGAQQTRVNLVAAGPLQTVAARNIEGFSDLEQAWSSRAPLGWDTKDPEPVARVICALLSDWTPAVTGEIIHVDGGVHAMGADIRS
jgi:meromycolic acid enoyl-[acyl-carrier-protein] reductase